MNRLKAKPAQGAPHGTRTTGRARSSPSAGARILAAIDEATEILRTEGLDSKQLTIRTRTVPPAPRTYRPGDVKRVRVLLGTSQAMLAAFLGVNVNTLRSWEQGKRIPQPIASRFLSEIETDIAYWRQRVEKETVGREPGKRSKRR
jgi:putative transcriptional regulator